MNTFREAFIASFDAACAAFGIDPNATLKPASPAAVEINTDELPPATTVPDALAYLRAGRTIYGTRKYGTQGELNAAIAKAQTQRAQAGPGDDPDLWEAYSLIQNDPSDLPNWNGRTLADYLAVAYPNFGEASGGRP